jgi:hypothetical protein
MRDEGDRPVDRSPWWRTGAGVVAWLVLAIAATAAAWGAVAVVGDQGELSPVALPSSRTGSGEATAEGSPRADPSSGETPETPGSDETAETPDTPEPGEGGATDTLSSPGGRVVVRCSPADSVVRVVASPNPGWEMVEESTGPDEVEVEFVNEDDEWRIRARCRDGVIDGEVDD